MAPMVRVPCLLKDRLLTRHRHPRPTASLPANNAKHHHQRKLKRHQHCVDSRTHDQPRFSSPSPRQRLQANLYRLHGSLPGSRDTHLRDTLHLPGPRLSARCGQGDPMGLAKMQKMCRLKAISAATMRCSTMKKLELCSRQRVMVRPIRSWPPAYRSPRKDADLMTKPKRT